MRNPSLEILNCIVCNKKLSDYNKSGCCIAHQKYSLRKRCKKCNKALLNKNKSDYCNIHRDRTGKNNSFYGKKHKQETIDTIKRKNKLISENLWKNKSYRNRIILGVSKPRREGFKEEQSIRIKKWFENNPKQRNLRSLCMKESWKLGRIIVNKNISLNSSIIEKKFFNDMKNMCGDRVERCTLRSPDGGWLFPDLIMFDIGYVIEFYGNYWHANPDIYSAEDIVHHGIKASEIWEKDEKRLKKLSSIGFETEIVWEQNYKKDRKSTLQKIDGFINWDSCSF